MGSAPISHPGRISQGAADGACAWILWGLTPWAECMAICADLNGLFAPQEGPGRETALADLRTPRGSCLEVGVGDRGSRSPGLGSLDLAHRRSLPSVGDLQGAYIRHMSTSHEDDLEAVEATLVEALASRKVISFVTAFQGCVASIAVGHAVVGIDLEAKRFATDCMDEWLGFGEVHCLVWGEDHRALSAASAKEASNGGGLTLAEAEAALSS